MRPSGAAPGLALRAAKTFHELAADYVARAVPDLAERTQADVRRYLKKDLLPRIGHLRIEEITGGEIVHMVEQIGKRSAVSLPYSAPRALARLVKATEGVALTP